MRVDNEMSADSRKTFQLESGACVRSSTGAMQEKDVSSRRWVLYLATGLVMSSGVCQSAIKASGTHAKVTDGAAVLGNELISVRVDAHLSELVILAPGASRTLPIGNAFSLTLKDGSVLPSSKLVASRPFRIQELQADPTSSQLAKTFPGKSICAEVMWPQGLGAGQWCAIVREGSSYIRQELSLQAGSETLPIASVTMLDFVDPGARVDGSVKGSPIVDKTMYFGFEHPLSISEVENDHVTVKLRRDLPLKQGQTIRYSSVIGIAPEGQMRRSFLSYLERERAHPYRTFLHYNTWYDLGFRNRFDEAGTLDRIHAFGEELVKKRGVVMDSFLLDDGWDDANTVWAFNSGFPAGLSPLRTAAAKYHFGIGIWLSPWGGYEKARDSRVAVGRAKGYEIVKNGFALSGPRYYSHFEQTCLNMIRQYGVNQFKFDGTGNANEVFPGSRFDSDFDAAIHLIEELRKASPNLYVNLTTGTYPSPFWLWAADSIWRGGMDHSFSGVGTWRQRWITYRDAQTYRRVVLAGPLFPLNSLMLHGLIFAKRADHLDTDPGHDFADEVHSYFGSGTQLQEMYITPSLLSEQDWTVLAETAKWSRANAAILKDTHWIGGDPDKLQIYGWAAWNGNRGILVLRNPSDKPQKISVDVGNAFELPRGAMRVYSMHSPWKSESELSFLRLRGGIPHEFALQPFQVLTLEGSANNSRRGS